MPFLVVYYATEDQQNNNKKALALADRFQRLAGATQGEVTVHGIEKLKSDAKSADPANAFVLEYNSKDQARNNTALLATLQDLVATFNGTSDKNEKPAILQLQRLTSEALETKLPDSIKLKL